MRTFKDAFDSEWTIELNIRSARDLRRKMQASTNPSLKSVDFLDYASILLSLNDVFFAADLLYLVCETEAQERGIDPETFGERLKGSALFDAIVVFTEEYLDFFPDPTTSQKMREVVEKSRAAQINLCDAICRKVETIMTEMVDDAEKKFGEESLEKSLSSAEDSTLTPELPTPN